MTTEKITKRTDVPHDLHLGFFQWAQAKHHGEIIAGIQTDESGNVYVVGDSSHPDFSKALLQAVSAWIDTKGEDI